MERISSRQNAAVKRFRELRNEPAGERVLLDGEHLLEEALKSDVAVEVAAFSERLADGPLTALVERARDRGARLLAVTDAVLEAISPVRHPSGVVAIAERRRATLDEAFAHAPQLVLMVSAVQDPGNVGAIIRAAEAFGATGIVTSPTTADPMGWKALRGAMGSTFRLPVARQSLADAAEAAKSRGVRVAAAVPRDGTAVARIDLRRPVAVMLGGEGAGLPADLLQLVDDRLTVPMRPPVESLNVAIAAGIVAYEAARQRGILR